MQAIQKRYIVDETNQKIAVQIDYESFRKIEDILENYALIHLMEENDDEEALDPGQARLYYQALKKKIENTYH